MNTNLKLKLKGLSCAHCATKIENDTNAMEEVEYASLNLIKQEMVVNLSEGKEDSNILQKIINIVHKHEKGMEVSIINDEIKEDEEDFKKQFIKKVYLLASGSILFLIGMFVNFQPEIQNILLLSSYLIFGFNVLKTALTNILKGEIFDENFLMSVATIGAIVIGEMPEAVFVMLFYQIGESFQDFAVDKSRKSIKKLMGIRPDFANLIKECDIICVSPESVKIGDIIIVKSGEKIPLDGIIIEGQSTLDTSALTGESVPIMVETGSEVLSGSINTNSILKIKVTKEFGESAVFKILELVENSASKKSKTEKFITKFAKIYTPFVVFSALALAIIPPIVLGTRDFEMWIGRALIFLVISCPCALVLSVPLGFFSGIGEASKRGILIKGSNYMQALTSVDTVVFDKTGTLTEGFFDVVSITTFNKFDEKELLNIVAHGEKMTNHPIGKSVVSYYEKQGGIFEDNAINSYEEVAGNGIKYIFNKKQIFVGNEKFMYINKIDYTKYQGLGSVVYSAVDGKYAGYIVVSDKIKEDSKNAILKLKELGIKQTVMLTGDKKSVAQKVSEELGIDLFFGELLPQNKVECMEKLFEKKCKGSIIFVGDGINDSPVLARADVGIAMGGLGSDAAIEAADVVIMNDKPSKIAEGIIIARNTQKIVFQNIVFALGIKIIVLGLGAFGFATMWMAVFADVGVSVIAVLNSMRKK